MPGLPYMQFYVGDWKRSADVQSLPYSERGVWFEMLCLMHDSPQRGCLCQADGTPLADDEVARLLGLSKQDFTNALAVLLRSKVTERNQNGALINRRMVRERLAKEAKSRAGKAGSDSRWLGKAIAEAWHLSLSEICLWIKSSEEDQKKIREGLEQWQEYRQRRAEPPKDWVLYWRKMLKFLGQYSIPVALEMIDTGIRSNWQTLYAPKHQANNHAVHRPQVATTITPPLKVKRL